MAVLSFFKPKTLILTLVTHLSISFLLLAQNKNLTFSAYGELYYSHDFTKSVKSEKPNFIYNFKRNNELSANLLLVRANYQDSTLRANIGVMLGNYAQYNLASEPLWGQFVYEANVGLKLSKRKNLWLDAGIMPSHIGFESAIGADCWTLTRSLVAENSPYYETGAKITSLSNNQKWSASFMYLNGWQKIQKPDNIKNPSWGMQIVYKPNSKLLLNYSNFFGTDKASFLKARRFYNNFYAIFEGKRIGVISGFDIGLDKYEVFQYGVWLSPVAILKYNLSEKSKLSIRAEYFDDGHQIILSSENAHKIKIMGVSMNFDYKINKFALWRIEAKQFRSTEALFNESKQDFSLCTSLIVRF